MGNLFHNCGPKTANYLSPKDLSVGVLVVFIHPLFEHFFRIPYHFITICIRIAFLSCHFITVRLRVKISGITLEYHTHPTVLGVRIKIRVRVMVRIRVRIRIRD